MNINQIKVEVRDTCKKRLKNNNFEAVNDEDVINKAYLNEKVSKIDGNLSFLEKGYNEFK